MKQYKELRSSRTAQNKYKNVKTELDGHVFGSKAEAKRYLELKLMLKTGEIKGFTMQPSFLLAKGVRYIPDFLVCGNDGICWAEDVKGVCTQAFKIKQKLWENQFGWLPLKIVK